MALKTHNVLCPCTDKIAARYRDRTFFFFSSEARGAFLQHPEQFVAQTEPLKVLLTCKLNEIKSQQLEKYLFFFLLCPPPPKIKPPALRIFVLGVRGSGKTTAGEWLAKQLDIFYIKFRDLLQMLIITKTKEKIPHADEVDTTAADSLAHLKALIKAARGENAKDDVPAKIQVSIYKLLCIASYLKL